ncbi:MAG: YfhO family protein [Planctomycetes bacterium]|nr:YfhO family protein [Planctomycetota bacterium]
MSKEKSIPSTVYSLFAVPFILLLLYVVFDFHFLFFNDAMNFMFPRLVFIKEQLSKGTLPFWDPNMGFGITLFPAVPIATLENSLLLLFSVKDTLVFTGILHIFLGMSFFFLMARSLCLSSYASILGGIIWCFNGYHTFFIHDQSIFGAAIFLPLIIYSFIKFSHQGKVSIWLVVSSLAFSLQALYGRPSDHVYNFVPCFLFIVFYILVNRKTTGYCWKLIVNKIFLFSLVTIVLGLLLAAFFVIPYINTLLNSSRFLGDGSLSLENHATRIIPFFAAIELILPNFINTYPSLYTRGFIGFIPFVLVVASLWSDFKWKYILWVIFSIAILMVFPFGLFDLFRTLPFQKSTWEPTRFITYITFSVSILAAVGFDTLFKNHIRGKEYKYYKHGFHFFLVGSVVSIVCFSTFSTYFKNHFTWFHFKICFISYILLVLLYLAFIKRVRLTYAFYVCIFGLVCTFYFNNINDKNDGNIVRKYELFSRHYPQKEWVKKLREESRTEFFRVADNTFYMGFWPYLLVPSVSFYTTVPSLDHILYFNKLIKDTTVLSPDIRNLTSLFYDLANVRYFVINRGRARHLDPTIYHPIHYDEERNVMLLENSKAFPRFYFVGGYKAIADRDETVKFMQEKEESDPSWFEDNVVLSTSENKPTLLTGSKRVKILGIDYGGNRINIKIDSEEETILVVSDAYSDGWKAFLDDKPHALYRANLLFRAVPIPKGKHNLSMKYRPPFFTLGVGISIGSFILVMAMCFFFYKKRSGEQNENVKV